MQPDRRLLLCCVVVAWSCCSTALTDAERDVFDQDDSIENYWRDSGDSDIPSILRKMYHDFEKGTHAGSETDLATEENDVTTTKKEAKKCNEDKECGTYGKCTADSDGGEGDKTCKCLKGISGEKCDIIDACLEGKKYAKCSGDDKGSCEYDRTTEEASCICSGPTVLNVGEGHCEAKKCNEDKECGTYGKCTADSDGGEGDKTCKCLEGISGNTCEDIKACKKDGKYASCSGGDKGTCQYDRTTEKAVCECSGDRKLNEKDGHCQVCACGLHSTKCTFEDGQKKCSCKNGYEEKNGLCTITEEQCKKVCGDDYRDKGITCDSQSQDVCQCGEAGMKFDYGNRKCKKSCESNSDCKNGANCTASEEEGNKFCKCLPGTLGDLCGHVPECEQKGKYGRCLEELGNCTFDVEKEAAVCVCSGQKKLDESKGYCRDCNCGVHAENCTFVEGTKTCHCKDRFAVRGETCEECDCGDFADECRFGKKNEKICKCKHNYKEYEGKCVDCNCGKFSITCELDADGEKICNCKHGFESKDGECKAAAICIEACGTEDEVVECKHDNGTANCVCPEDSLKFDYTTKRCRETCDSNSQKPCDNGAQCTREPLRKEADFCSCLEGTAGHRCQDIEDCLSGKYQNCTGGAKGECTYDPVEKLTHCECGESQSLKDVDLYCEECDCGPHGNCTFVGNEKTCDCEEEFEDNKGTCQECKCGENSLSCGFEDGKKTCQCRPGFADNDGTCQECDCGEGSTACRFVGGLPTCECKDLFSVKNGKCEKCDCGNFSKKCSFENDKKVCDCHDQYEDNDGTCEKCYCGENSQKCSFKDGKITCECKTGFAQKGEECAECKCAKNTKPCRFDGDEKKCDCKDKYALKNGTCTSCKCGPNSIGCKFEGDAAICDCEKGYGNKAGKCAVNYCYRKCGVEEGTENDDLKCEGEVLDERVECVCYDDDLKFDPNERKCRTSCSGKDQCSNGAECEQRGGDRFCACPRGTEGDTCEVVTDCVDGRFKRCDAPAGRGNCTYDRKAKEAVCLCPKDRQLDPKDGYCQNNCQTDGDCSKEGKICQPAKKYCTCEEGKEGDTCQIVTGCTAELEGRCKKADAECVFDGAEEGRATCKCINEALTYDKSTNQCVSKFCKEVGCTSPAKCEYDELTDTGYCKCPKGYYDYRQQKCQEPDKCLLRKTPCKENEVCEKGVCKCKYEMDGDQCKPKFCLDNRACFKGANCSQEDGSCTCVEGTYFTGSECKDATCVTGGLEKCGCPFGMVPKDGKCQPKSGKSCDKNCGYGYCVDDKCVCLSIAVNLNDKCVLDAAKVCASKKLNADSSKCECTGKYKQAKDGITCELVTCSDDARQKECDAKGGTCEMRWNGASPGYFCKCRDGYSEDQEKGICSDTCSRIEMTRRCSTQDKFCYNSYSPLNSATGDCECPPPFTQDSDGNCRKLAEYVYIINNIPVMKKRYEMKKDVDHVLLNRDLVQSISQMFSAATFEYAHLNDYVVEGDLVLSSVWVRFKQDPRAEMERITFQAQTFPNSTCDDCDPERFLLPPSLLLSKKDFGKVAYQNMTMCSKPLKDTLCGEEALCSDNKCFCPRGYKPIEYSIRDITEGVTVLRCEVTKKNDVDECAHNLHQCSENTTCVKTPGDYICQCKPGYKKATENDKNTCYDLCTPSPCENKGECSMKNNLIHCKCEPGFQGSLCEEKDVRLAGAKKSTVIVGAVLGTLLGVLIIAFFVLYRKVRKSSYSEDFMPAPRQDHASEMMERRPVRGVVNKSYE